MSNISSGSVRHVVKIDLSKNLEFLIIFAFIRRGWTHLGDHTLHHVNISVPRTVDCEYMGSLL